MNNLKNIGALKADYEAGIYSRVDIATKHGISTVTLWRYASKGKWSYGKIREQVLESLSQSAIERLSKLTESVIEEHVFLLSDIRRKIMVLNDLKEVKHYSSQVGALLKCIKGERTALGLPNHIVGMSTYGSELIVWQWRISGGYSQGMGLELWRLFAKVNGKDVLWGRYTLRFSISENLIQSCQAAAKELLRSFVEGFQL